MNSGVEQDAQHAAQGFGSTPEQLVADGEGAHILGSHRQLADTAHGNGQRAGRGHRGQVLDGGFAGVGYHLDPLVVGCNQSAFAATTVVQGAETDPNTTGALDLDLDLDFSVESPAAPAVENTQALEFTPEAPVAEEPTVALEVPAPEPDMGLSFDLPVDTSAVAQEELAPDFDLPALDMTLDTTASPVEAPPALDDANGLAFDLAFTPSDAPPAPPVASPAEQLDDGLNLDFDLPINTAEAAAPPMAPDSVAGFDLDSLSLDLGDTPTTESPALDAGSLTLPEDDLPDDPLATKLALAEEFHAIGDDEGARSLAEEVMAEATGNLKIRAQRFLGGLG